MEDQDILLRIRKEENAAFQLLYKFYFPTIQKYILQNSGTIADAEDIFQESLITLIHKSRDPAFVLSASLKTYLFAIAKNLWLKKLRDKKEASHENMDAFDTIDESFINNEEPSLAEKITELMHVLSAGCVKVLHQFYWLNQPIEAIMMMSGYKNRHSVSTLKNKCLTTIRKLANK